ncbi:unnamed protein product [Lymnaea stagnalis]|uniref:Poly [ADP-ribose] polymerase n=1 Tax=Lymnaea stagnalis TaxID=6523 RepID=A0AAV2H6E7_LYMST
MNVKDQIHLTCPVETCWEIIDIELVTRQIDPLTYDLLNKKLLNRQESASEEVEEYLYQKISCLSCKTIAAMDKKAIHFKCRNCSKEYCSYCHKDWPGSNLHNECRLLNCSGTKCFQELHVPPDNWEESYSALNIEQNELKGLPKTSLVSLNGREGRAIISLFIQTSPDLWITKIIRLQNMKLWEKYVLKRKHMVEEIGVSNVNERVLFHGTNEKNISLISEEGFDMRVETANGALFGKGTYFSTTSKYSQIYSGSSNKMFMVRVLCGYSVQGSASYKRPPKDTSGRLYDSCVNNESGPNIYCLFDNSQCYPAYVIEYKKK